MTAPARIPPLFARLFIGVLIAVAAANAVAGAGFALRVAMDRRRFQFAPIEAHADEMVARLNATPIAQRPDVLFELEAAHGVPMRLLEPPPFGPHGERPPPPPVPHAHPLADGWILAIGEPFPGPGPWSWTLFAAQIVGVVGVVALVGWRLSAPLVRDLDALEKTAAKLGAGDLSTRAAILPGSQVGALAAGFNGMADKVEQMMRDQRQLFQAVSHELRTPNARIRFQLEAVADADDPAVRARLVRAIDDDLSEVDRLVDELLTWLRFETDASGVHGERVAVGPVFDDLVDRLAPLHPDIALSLEAVDGGLSVSGQRRAFVRAVENLLTNGVRHARSRVVLAAVQDGAEVVVTVDDDGPGVPVADRARIFEPFISTDASWSRSLGGVGLGLAIVRRILEHHGGTVAVGDSPLGGARFTVRWPGGQAVGESRR